MHILSLPSHGLLTVSTKQKKVINEGYRNSHRSSKDDQCIYSPTYIAIKYKYTSKKYKYLQLLLLLLLLEFKETVDLFTNPKRSIQWQKHAQPRICTRTRICTLAYEYKCMHMRTQPHTLAGIYAQSVAYFRTHTHAVTCMNAHLCTHAHAQTLATHPCYAHLLRTLVHTRTHTRARTLVSRISFENPAPRQ